MERVKLNKECLNELKDILDMSSLTLSLEWFKINKARKNSRKNSDLRKLI